MDREFKVNRVLLYDIIELNICKIGKSFVTFTAMSIKDISS